ncbi:hypothetical protein GCM10023193_18380 [Planotetraspora kaengkrachanensis]|uniref:Uncharacterized protein n=2 Tax=Planotetraspora kaengkrachanensis TaxID=575193 RepID=A0A8J3LZN4_9ACTN|nr:hypothetical protein Pka01_28120 [Planotetraspora kaengkrachanensis]
MNGQMAKLIERIKEYLRGPQGRRMTEKAKTMARDPRNRERLQRLMDRMRGHKQPH